MEESELFKPSDMKSNLFRIIIYLGSVQFFFIEGCNNHTAVSEKKIVNDSVPNHSQIEGFYIFKKNMSFTEVKNLLELKKIRFRQINLENENEINTPIDGSFVNSITLKYFKNIKVIEGQNLLIFNYQLPKFQIGFFNDTIFYFKYYRNLESIYLPENETKGDLQFSTGVENDIGLLTKLSEGFKYKYGNPTRGDSNLDALYASLPYSKVNNDTLNITVYKKEQLWIDKKTEMNINLKNVCIKDSSLSYPRAPKKIAYISTVEVVFDNEFARYIYNFVMAKNEYEKNKENNLQKVTSDSLNKKQIKQFDSL